MRVPSLAAVAARLPGGVGGTARGGSTRRPGAAVWLFLLAASAAAADTTAPTLETAAADWTRIALTFSEDLDADAIPAASTFPVVVGGSSRAVAGISVSGDSVVLALTLPVMPTDAVTVAYEAPSEGGLADEAGNAVASFAATAATNGTPERLATEGPGLGNLPYASSEVFQPMSAIRNIAAAPGETSIRFGLNLGIMLNGYFVTVFAPDSGESPGGFLVYDVSDPRNIRLERQVYRPRGDTSDFREQHSLPTARIGDSVYMALQTTQGVEIWDLTDMNDIHREGKLRLPGVSGGDYDNAVWQLSWQAPYLYVATTGQGFQVVDTRDPAAPFIADRGHRRANPVPPAEYGGFRVGPIFAMGNHLVVTGMDTFEGWSSLGIGNPLNPVLMDTIRVPRSAHYYATCFDGRYVYSAPRLREPPVPGGDRPFLQAPVLGYDLADPADFVLVNNSLSLVHRTYCGTQDHFLFQGGRNDVRKIDVSDSTNWIEVGRGVLGVERADHGQVSPMGNLVFVGDDHGSKSAFFVHDADPDLTPPDIVAVSPRDRAVNQLLTTRVGVAFTDSVLLASVGPDTVRLLDADEEVVSGTYSAHLGIVNFSPAEPLEPNTTYTVQVVAGGVSDYAGNRIESAFRTTFTTTPDLAVEPSHRWALEDDAEDWFDRNDGTVVGGAFATDGGLELNGDGAWVRLAGSLSTVLAGDAALAFFLSTSQTGERERRGGPGSDGQEGFQRNGRRLLGVAGRHRPAAPVRRERCRHQVAGAGQRRHDPSLRADARCRHRRTRHVPGRREDRSRHRRHRAQGRRWQLRPAGGHRRQRRESRRNAGGCPGLQSRAEREPDFPAVRQCGERVRPVDAPFLGNGGFGGEFRGRSPGR